MIHAQSTALLGGALSAAATMQYAGAAFANHHEQMDGYELVSSAPSPSSLQQPSGHGSGAGSAGNAGGANGGNNTKPFSASLMLGNTEQLFFAHRNELAGIQTVHGRIKYVNHIAELMKRRSPEAFWFSPQARMLGWRLLIEVIDDFMGDAPPAHKPSTHDSHISAILSPALREVCKTERDLFRQGIYTVGTMKSAATVHLAHAKRVDYYKLLLRMRQQDDAGSAFSHLAATLGRKLMQMPQADTYTFNLILLRGMEAARRFHRVEENNRAFHRVAHNQMYSHTIMFLNGINDSSGTGTLNAQRIVDSLIADLAKRMAHMTQQKFIDMVDEQMMGLYSFTPYIYERLSKVAAHFKLEELMNMLESRFREHQYIGAKLGLSAQPNS